MNRRPHVRWVRAVVLAAAVAVFVLCALIWLVDL